MGKGATSYLHSMQQYKDIDVNAYRLLDPRDTYPAYPGNHSDVCNNVYHKVLTFNLVPN